MKPVKLDDIDKQILRILQLEGRISNKELATRINLTTTPTLERVRRLEREGVIASYEAKVDPKAVNMGLNAFVTVTLDVVLFSLSVSDKVGEVASALDINFRS